MALNLWRAFAISEYTPQYESALRYSCCLLIFQPAKGAWTGQIRSAIESLKCNGSLAAAADARAKAAQLPEDSRRKMKQSITDMKLKASQSVYDTTNAMQDMTDRLTRAFLTENNVPETQENAPADEMWWK